MLPDFEEAASSLDYERSIKTSITLPDWRSGLVRPSLAFEEHPGLMTIDFRRDGMPFPPRADSRSQIVDIP